MPPRTDNSHLRPLICYDLPTVSLFTRSVAMAVMVDRHTHLAWETYRDSTVLNGIYFVMFWKEPPGTVVVQSPPIRQIQADVDRLHAEYLIRFVTLAGTEGAGAAQAYIRRLETLKANSRANTNWKYGEARSINSEIQGETNAAIRKLAAIKLGATVGIAIIGAGAGIALVGASAAAAGGAGAAGAAASGVSAFGLQLGAGSAAFSAVGTGYSVLTSVIKDWGAGEGAGAVAMSGGFELGKGVVSDVAGGAGEKMMTEGIAQMAKSDQAMKSAQGTIDHLTRELSRKAGKKNAIKHINKGIGTATETVARNQALAESAGRAARFGGVAARGVPVIFAAWDILDAVSEFSDTWKATAN